MTQETAPYQNLTPDTVLDAVDSLGLRTDGRLLALNSYENRVYRVGIEEERPVVAKFYRPGRWTDAQILEEHAFTQALAAAEIPVVAPWAGAEGKTLHEYNDFRFSLYPLQPGRTPNLEDFDTLEWLGRFLGRIHAAGAQQPYIHRIALTPAVFGREAADYVLEQGFVPDDIRLAYSTVVDEVLGKVERIYATLPELNVLRVHGDCHPGNVLWTEDVGPHFVDFDDSMTGPAIQDLWMLLSGERAEQVAQLDAILAGYREFADFDVTELRLIEPLRTLRMIHYSAWLARRWQDPAFPRNFPWFGNAQRYWQDQILALREQSALLDEPPLELY